MHPTSVFAWTDRAELLAFVAERAFATLIAHLDGQLVCAQAPVLVDRPAPPLGGAAGRGQAAAVDGDRLLLHLSRANPIARALPQRVLAVVSGPDAYVSPDWYAERDQVPTWNYVSAEIGGELHATDDATLRDILDRESAAFEARLVGKPPWMVAGMPPAILAAKLKGIIGVGLPIETIRGTRKLSQNRTAADRAGVVASLATSPREADRAVAALLSTSDDR